MRHNNTVVFGEPPIGSQATKFPIIITGDNGDDTYPCIIDESRITTAQKILLLSALKQ